MCSRVPSNARSRLARILRARTSQEPCSNHWILNASTCLRTLGLGDGNFAQEHSESLMSLQESACGRHFEPRALVVNVNTQASV